MSSSDAVLIDPATFERMVAFRREMHQFPELSGREDKTADRIANYLAELGIEFRVGVGGLGIIADIPGIDATKGIIALRADMDALPIQEETGLAFASSVPGVMHACGHDGHTSMLLGAAKLILEAGPLPTPVRLVFQPSEEIGLGAKSMIGEGALDNVSLIFGGHIDRHYPLGSVVVTDGVVNASSDLFSIQISGKGGHGGRPHETVDAVVAGSLLVTALQTIVSREVNPDHPSVVSVGLFQAGSAANVIADHAELHGTIRAQEQDVRLALHQSIQRIAEAIGQLHNAKTETQIQLGTPPVRNSHNATDLARRAASLVMRSDQIPELEVANMGGEDFAYYLQETAGCYVRFGCSVEGAESWPAHSSRFDFDERVLGVGAAYYSQIVRIAGEALIQGG